VYRVQTGGEVEEKGRAMTNKHVTAANSDVYLVATVAKIREQIPGASIRIAMGNHKWSCIIENYKVRGSGFATTPSEAILQAWHKAVGSEVSPF